LPNDKYSPAGFLKYLPVSAVASDVLCELYLPEGCPCSRCGGFQTTLVPVPETAMHEDNNFVLWKDNVREARESVVPKTEPITHTVEQGTHHDLWFGVLRPDVAHIPTAPAG